MGVMFQCPLCGDFCKSHALLFAHTADAHPGRLDKMAVGCLGAIMIYQGTAKLFHCLECFFTAKSFPGLYDHIVTTHCMDGQKDDAGGREDGGDKRVDCKAEEIGEEGEAEKIGKADSLKRKRSSEGDDEEEGEDDSIQKGDDKNTGAGVSAATSEEGFPYFDGKYYRCQGCAFTTKLRTAAINHVVKRHKIARSYASAHVPYKKRQSNEEEAIIATAQSKSNFLREELEATAKLFKFVGNRYICATCGWKTKVKGHILSHNAQSHRMSFFLPSMFQQHMCAAHRVGCYGCPFCAFRSDNLRGFRYHCKCCNVPEEERGDGRGQGERGDGRGHGERGDGRGQGERGDGRGQGERGDGRGQGERGEGDRGKGDGEEEKRGDRAINGGEEKGDGGGGGEEEEGGAEGDNGEGRQGDGSRHVHT